MTNVKGILATAPVVSRDSVVSSQMETPAVSVAEAVVKVLENLGVEYAFGVSGGAIAPIWAALERSSINVLHFRHEAGAAFGAVEAYFASGKPVVVFATTGPGITNALTGLFAARWEGARVIFLSASTSAPQRGRWACQETSSYTMPVEGIFTSGTLFHYGTTLETSEQLPEISLRLRKGLLELGGFVAHVSISIAIQSQVVASLPQINLSHYPAVPRKKTIKKCAELLSEAPFAIWLGFGARDAAKSILKLAERTGAAVICSPRGKGIFPENHPQFVGVTGIGGHRSVLTYMQEYLPERVLVLGTRLGELTSFWNPAMVPKRGFIHVDLNPEASGVAYPEVETISIQSDVKVFVKRLLKRLPKSPDPSTATVLPQPERLALSPQEASPIRSEVLMTAIQRVIVERGDVLVMAEPGNSFAWATHWLQFSQSHCYRTSTSFASMGHMVAGIVGAAAVLCGKVVAIVGDGAMLMNCEVSTAVKYQVPAVWIVLNDGYYNMVDQVLPEMNCKHLVQIPSTDFVQVARGMGADGIRVEREFEIEAALEKALASKVPFVVDVVIDPTRKAPTETRMMSLKNQCLKN